MKKVVFVKVIVLMIFCLCLCLCLCLLGVNASAVERNKVKIGFTNNPPYAFQEGGKAKGIRLELAKEAIKRAGYIFEPEFLPWKRALVHLKQGQIDGLILWYKPERKSFVYYPRYPFTLEVTAIFRKTDTPALPYKDIEDFKGLRIGIIRGFAYPKEFMNAKFFIRDEVANIDQNLIKLSMGRIDATLEDSDGGDYKVRQLNLQEKIYKNPIHFNHGIWNYLGWSKKSTQGKALADLYDTVIVEMIKDGTYRRIYEKYLGRPPIKLPEIENNR